MIFFWLLSLLMALLQASFCSQSGAHFDQGRNFISNFAVGASGLIGTRGLCHGPLTDTSTASSVPCDAETCSQGNSWMLVSPLILCLPSPLCAGSGPCYLVVLIQGRKLSGLVTLEFFSRGMPILTPESWLPMEMTSSLVAKAL